MTSLAQKAVLDNRIMKALKVSEIRHIVAHTSKGDLALALPFGGESKDYYFVLDAVPCDTETQDSLFALYNGILYDIA